MSLNFTLEEREIGEKQLSQGNKLVILPKKRLVVTVERNKPYVAFPKTVVEQNISTWMWQDRRVISKIIPKRKLTPQQFESMQLEDLRQIMTERNRDRNR